MDADIQDVVVLINQPHGFLHLAPDFYFLKPGKFTNAMVDVRHKIARNQFPQKARVQGLLLGKALPDFVLVIALKI